MIEDIDLILIMSVNPGFGGQSFIDSALRKIEQARRRIDACGRDIRLEVDGGIKADNIARVAAAGADTFVAGSAIFGKPDYKRGDRRHARRAQGLSFFSPSGASSPQFLVGLVQHRALVGIDQAALDVVVGDLAHALARRLIRGLAVGRLVALVRHARHRLLGRALGRARVALARRCALASSGRRRLGIRLCMAVPFARLSPMVRRARAPRR